MEETQTDIERGEKAWNLYGLGLIASADPEIRIGGLEKQEVIAMNAAGVLVGVKSKGWLTVDVYCTVCPWTDSDHSKDETFEIAETIAKFEIKHREQLPTCPGTVHSNERSV